MPTPDWYTGSDASGRVARGIETVIERMDSHQADHGDISALEQLLDIEEENNWRAFVLSLAGTIHYDLDEIETAEKLLGASLDAYKVFLETFDDVLSVYCQSCYTLGTILFDQEKYVDAMPLFIRCLPYMHEVYEEPFIGNVHAQLDICLAWINDHGNSVIFAEAAAYSRRCDCASLERLMSAYGHGGKMTLATEVFQLLSTRCQDYEHFDRVLDFARRKLGETGVVN